MTNEALFRSIEKNIERYCTLSDAVFDHPETGRNEYFACSELEQLLEKEGFTVEHGVGGIATAFRAVWENGSGGPSVGLLCEYDALPEYGHACGHHMQGPAICAAAAALKECAGDAPFRIVVYGTPDEEFGNGKIEMLRNGCFRDIDIALMTHAGPNTTVDVKSLAQRIYVAEYFGKKAHAALKPEDGRSAVDAMMLAVHGLELLREHVRDDVRLHYAILEASKTSNTVPDYAKIEFNLRSYSTEYLETVCKRFEKVMEGAAVMTETRVSYADTFDCMAKIPVLSLNERIMRYAEELDAPQRIPFREKTGSTDFANVLHELPGSCVRVAFVPEGTASHSEKFLAEGKSPAMHRAIGNAAKILSCVSRDLIEDREFFRTVREEFAERKRSEAETLSE